MNQKDEISSTERLLNTIRKKTSDPEELSGKAPPPVEFALGKTNFSGILKGVWTKNQSITIGVSLGYRDMLLTMVILKFGHQYQLEKWQRIPYPDNITKESAQFPSFLKKKLDIFSAPHRRVRIWCVMASTGVETRYLSIPFVAPQQIPNAVFWTLKKEIPFQEDENIFDYDVVASQPSTPPERNAKKLQVLTYVAPKKAIKACRNLFQNPYSVTGVSIVAFTFQNLLRLNVLKTPGKNVCTLFVGSDWSRIDIFSNGALLLSRDIKTGMNSLVESVREGLEDYLNAQVSKSQDTEAIQDTGIPFDPEPTLSLDIDLPQDARSLSLIPPVLELDSSSGPQDPQTAETSMPPLEENDAAEIETSFARKIFEEFMIYSDDTLKQDYRFHMGNHEIFEMLQPVFERLVRQIERTLEYYRVNFKSEAVSKIFITGPACKYKILIEYLGDQIRIPVTPVDPFAMDILIPQPHNIPATPEEKDAFAPAIGIGLSDNAHTPNFIFTYRQKQILSRARKVNRIFLVIFLVCFTAMGGDFYIQSRIMSVQKEKEQALQVSLDQFPIKLNEDVIRQYAAKIQENKQLLHTTAEHFKGLAILAEVLRIVRLNPSTKNHIRLIKMVSNFGLPPKEPKKPLEEGERAEGSLEDEADQEAEGAAENAAAPPTTLVIEGIVYGDMADIKSVLVGFREDLKASPLFKRVIIQKKPLPNNAPEELYGDKEAQRFTAHLETVS